MSGESPSGVRDNEHRRWHALHAEEAVAAVESDADGGLSAEQACKRLERFGPNALPGSKRRSLLSVFLGQFKSPLIYLLFAAAVIFTVVLLNAVIGAFQEGRAERSLEALRKLATHKARVVRGGQ